MGSANFIDLVCQGLPPDISHSKGMACSSDNAGMAEQKEAVFSWLKRHPRLNWQAYLECYPDVKAAGIDPVIHYLNHGIYEGRKLASWSVYHRISNKTRPKVSVVVTNYNNAAFLAKCLDSVVTQTLKDIELIVVDDASKDDSVEILRRFAAADSRIRTIEFPVNRGTHSARKTGIAATQGEYVTFLDSDDFFAPEACEKAYQAIAQGHDVVSFGVNTISQFSMTPAERVAEETFINRFPSGVYSRGEMLDSSFIKHNTNWNLAFRMYERDLAAYAFKDLSDDYLAHGEDPYEFLAICNLARSFIQITDRLYYYNRDAGCTSLGRLNGGDFCGNFANASLETLTPGDMRFLPSLGMRFRLGTLKCMKDLCEKVGLEYIYPYYESRIFNDEFFRMAFRDPCGIEAYISNLKKFFTVEYIVEKIRGGYTDRKLLLAEWLSHYPIKLRKVRKIVILYERLSGGGVETTLQNFCCAMSQKGHQIYLVLYKRSTTDVSYRNFADIRYICPTGGGVDNLRAHIKGLHDALCEIRPDVLLHMECHNPNMIWDILLCRLLDIGIVSSLRVNHDWDFLFRRRDFTHDHLIVNLRALDKFTCLDISSEIYLRSRGVDAVYLPNTIKPMGAVSNLEGSDIAFFGRQGDRRKGFISGLRALRKIIAKRPEARLMFIGGFDRPEAEREFYRVVRAMNLDANVHVTGWLDHPGEALAQCSLMLFTSFIEGFPNAVSEAQACGLPVVMYDLDIMLAKKNESIIRVPQGDWGAAADAVVDLLNNGAERARLSKIALETVKRYSAERFASGFADVFASMGRSSPVRYYTHAEYQNALRWEAFYAGKTIQRDHE